jgi:hypothetical protein
VELIAENNQSNSNNSIAPRKRGRPLGSTKAFARAMEWEARGVGPLKAHDVLMMAGERKQWRRIFACEDERVILQAMVFLVSMRDGKPAQQINVTSQSISVSVDDIAKARAIVRELVDGISGGSPSVRGEEQAKHEQPLMLCEGEGGKLGG